MCLHQVVACLKDAGRYARLNARMPSGVLLTGAPGTGKTLLGKPSGCSVNRECAVPSAAVIEGIEWLAVHSFHLSQFHAYGEGQ